MVVVMVNLMIATAMIVDAENVENVVVVAKLRVFCIIYKSIDVHFVFSAHRPPGQPRL